MRAPYKLLTIVAVAALFVIASCGTEETVVPVDTTPPVAPTQVALETDATQVRVYWAENAEPDIAGYNVYSSWREEGPFRRLNDELLLCPWYFDAPTPMEITYYRVAAVDASGNESAYSQVLGIYFSTMGDRNAPSRNIEEG